MISFFFRFVATSNPYITLGSDICQTSYCGDINSVVDVYPPFVSQFVVAITAIGDGVKTSIHSPSTASGITINPQTSNSFIFTSGNSKLSFNFTKADQCIYLASMSIPTCSSGVQVITQIDYAEVIQSDVNQDYCIFFAPASTNAYWNATNVSLGNGYVDVYTSSLERTYLTIQNSDQPYSTTSSTPWFFRYHSGSEEDPNARGCTLNLKAYELYNNSIQLVLTPTTFIVSPHVAETNYFYPIFGSICPLALLLVAIITLLTLFKKSPVEGILL